MTGRPSFAVDLVFFIPRFLLEPDQLEPLRRVLVRRAPRWASGLRAHTAGTRERQPISTASATGFTRMLAEAATARGPTYRALADTYGEGPSRLFGGVELRGSDASLVLSISVDEYVLPRSGSLWTWGNRISVQVRRARVDGVDSVSWSGEVFAELCEHLAPVYARGGATSDYRAKNIVSDRSGTRAVGVDFSKALPGVYWLNFLGRPYVTLMGRDRVLSTPAALVASLDDGVLIKLTDAPGDEGNAIYRAAEQAAVRHLGADHFFSRDDPGRQTVAPDFHDLIEPGMEDRLSGLT